MRISVTDAKAQLTELVRRAEAGDEIILTRHGQPAANSCQLRQPKTGSPGAPCSKPYARPPSPRRRRAQAQRDPRTFSYAERGLPE